MPWIAVSPPAGVRSVTAYDSHVVRRLVQIAAYIESVRERLGPDSFESSGKTRPALVTLVTSAASDM